ncbi:MAG: NADP(H)-dependent aldo-keto reductase [Gammaproteobacteria bacterium]
MHYNPLGDTGIQVSRICLGTMTWGEQNTEAEAHEQLDYALDQGINFIDTAEMYPVPPKAETQGRTEAYIGSWLNRRKCRDKIILASKVAGPAERVKHIRPHLRLDRENIEAAIEASLRRLQTDYLDLYQLHWPDRTANYFGQLGYVHREDESPVPIEETLSVLNDLVRAGKVRYVGISNETPWGTMAYLRAAERLGLPRIVSIQNPYSLLNRTFEIGLAEIAHREKVGLLAYSPLAFGMLSGKYSGGAKPAGARLTRWAYFDRYSNPQAIAATEAYVALARKEGLSPAQMALAFVNRQPFLTSNIIGATSMEQLRENIASDSMDLSDEILEAIEAIHREHPNPSP